MTTLGGGSTVLHRPGTVGEAVASLAAEASAGRQVRLLAGGTDLVPALRAAVRGPAAIVALRRVLELRVRGASADTLTVGAGVTYADLEGWSLAPGLAATSRTVGSAQIRNCGTVGGALGSANPRGDLLTFLSAADAEVLLATAGGNRSTGIADYLRTGPDPGELVTAVRMARPSGPQTYLKIGGRQAAFPAVVSCALLVDRVRERVCCAVGGVATGPWRVATAERGVRDEVDWVTGTAPAAVARRFGQLVAEALRGAPPLPEDPRHPAEYRVHAGGVLAARAFARCLGAVPGAGRSG
ncbi:aerobic-type carbon monoxide dehydrogenase, middle subunit CoxM/CutM-like protein [Frankia sp. EI5c]|uniref:FAD binding domain-containing protein n=1 Tax=Frankia sp. EI5c TaxID=683316 RepID=UPI0007C2EBF3|nr:FAD binding domain-containing protein [Frankia sp. EI5c]OAA26214.1 aerobic-type carbon monoxide dehydrogenase, middle subunit CoxM/CutM-like protein [Frankia sp. EI5c]